MECFLTIAYILRVIAVLNDNVWVKNMILCSLLNIRIGIQKKRFLRVIYHLFPFLTASMNSTRQYLQKCELRSNHARGVRIPCKAVPITTLNKLNIKNVKHPFKR